MKQILFAVALILLAFVSYQASAEGTDFFINLGAPGAKKTAPSTGKSFFIRSVTDSRSFEDPTARPDIPSWGIVDEKERSEERKNKSVARASKRGGRMEGNVLIVVGDVKTIMRDATANILSGLGYSIIEKEEDVGTETIPVDIEVKKFWGHFREIFIGGTMTATIEAAITLNMKGVKKTRTIQVEARMSARYPNKTTNWEEVFRTALGYFSDTARNELLQAIAQ